MAEGAGDERGGFLPPEPAGPPPDLGEEPAQPQPSPQAPPQGWQPPGQAPQPGPGWQQPPAGWQPPPQGWQPPPPGWQPPPAGSQPQAGWHTPQAQWGWQAQPKAPGNGQAVAGFILSLTALGLLVLSAGLSSIVSVGCAAFGISYSVAGRRRVDRGETPQHRGLAQAGFVIGITALVLALLATAGWILLIALGDS